MAPLVNTIWILLARGRREVFVCEPREYRGPVAPERLPRFDLQRFAAEDEGRTEDPTERRLREEREKGNVPKSQDITQAAVLIGTVAALFMMGGFMVKMMMELFQRYLSMDFAALSQMTSADITTMALGAFWYSTLIIAPVGIAAVVTAIAGGITQVGLLFTLQPLAVKLERLKPDFKRVLPNRRTAVNLLKVLFQMLLLSIASYIIIVDDYISMLKTANMGLTQALLLFGYVGFKLLVVSALILLALSIPDYFYQRFEYMENLKMTVSESRRERKDEEGDPMIRQRQRERAYELRNQRNMLSEVPVAEVDINNTKHIAVALLNDRHPRKAPLF